MEQIAKRRGCQFGQLSSGIRKYEQITNIEKEPHTYLCK